VPLTEAEVQAAQDAARQAKWQSIKNAQYAWDVSYPAPKQPVTCELLLAAKLREAQAQGLHYEGHALQVLRQLAWYFSDDGVHALPEGPDPNKGLLLAGPVGCGKTTLLRLFMRNPAQNFGVVSARTVASTYQTKGAPGLEPYLTAYYSGGVVFDDLGT
jgi:predicted ATPase